MQCMPHTDHLLQSALGTLHTSLWTMLCTNRPNRNIHHNKTHNINTHTQSMTYKIYTRKTKLQA